MAKEKDPAFLFYSKDFYEGTRLMLPKERACFIDLLIYQHQNGFIPKDLSRIVLYCSGIDEATLIATLEAKFIATLEGWYNAKLKKVMEERSEFTTKQSGNGLIGQFFKKAKSTLKSDIYKKLQSYIYEVYGKEKLIIELKEAEATHEAMLEAMLKHLEDANEDVNKDILSIVEVVNYLNLKTGKRFSSETKETQKLVGARLKKYSIDEAKKVIDIKVLQWVNNSDMQKYLAPDTLFAEKNFEKYLNEVPNLEGKPIVRVDASEIFGNTHNA